MRTGRPKKYADRASHKLQVRVTEKQMADIKELADKKHMGVSDWVRAYGLVGAIGMENPAAVAAITADVVRGGDREVERVLIDQEEEAQLKRHGMRQERLEFV